MRREAERVAARSVAVAIDLDDELPLRRASFGTVNTTLISTPGTSGSGVPAILLC
jgi:hypothetical protein